MKRILSAFPALALIAAPAAAFAQAALPMVPATVKKIDTDTGKITLDHGPIPNLDMGAMSMVFKAGDPEVLKTLKVGDKVKFTADRVNGQITATSIQKAK